MKRPDLNAGEVDSNLRDAREVVPELREGTVNALTAIAEARRAVAA